MQKIGQRMLVVVVGRCDDYAMNQSELAVHSNVQLHAKVQLLALLG